jgi:hypothetical protein
MDDKATLESVADACIAAHKLVMQRGTQEMQAASRSLLYAVARELVRQETEDGSAEAEGHQAPHGPTGRTSAA